MSVPGHEYAFATALTRVWLSAARWYIAAAVPDDTRRGTVSWSKTFRSWPLSWNRCLRQGWLWSGLVGWSDPRRARISSKTLLLTAIPVNRPPISRTSPGIPTATAAQVDENGWKRSGKRVFSAYFSSRHDRSAPSRTALGVGSEGGSLSMCRTLIASKVHAWCIRAPA